MFVRGGSSTIAVLVLLKNCCYFCTHRDNAVSPEAENDAQITQRYWMEIRQMVRAIYRESMSLSSRFTIALAPGVPISMS